MLLLKKLIFFFLSQITFMQIFLGNLINLPTLILTASWAGVSVKALTILWKTRTLQLFTLVNQLSSSTSLSAFTAKHRLGRQL